MTRTAIFFITIAILGLSHSHIVFPGPEDAKARDRSTLPEGSLRLPTPGRLDLSLGDALRARRSTRSFTDRKLDPRQLGTLLWAQGGINRPDPEHARGGKRTVPSAFGSDAVDVLIATADGTYRYSPQHHALLPLGDLAGKDLRKKLVSSDWVASASVLALLVADYERYPERVSAERRVHYAHADAAVIAQNNYLACAAMGLGTVLTANARREAGEVLGLGENHRVIFALPIGYAKEENQE